MIPLSNPNQSKIVAAELADALHALQLSKVEYGVMIDAEFYQRERLETCRLSQRTYPGGQCQSRPTSSKARLRDLLIRCQAAVFLSGPL